MIRFGTMVGIDPSGSHLALVAVRWTPWGSRPVAPPTWFPLEGADEAARIAEAEGHLRDFVSRHALSGVSARLLVPARLAYSAHVDLPSLPPADLRRALEQEMDRIFPVPPGTLAFAWERLGPAGNGKGTRLKVSAVDASYLEAWEEAVSRAGLRLEGAIPADACLAAALRTVHPLSVQPGKTTALLRGFSGSVECTLFDGGIPFHCNAEPFASGEAGSVAANMLDEGFLDPPGDRPPSEAAIHAPPTLIPALVRTEWTVTDTSSPGLDTPPFSWETLGTTGAALCDGVPNLLVSAGSTLLPRVTSALTTLLAAAAVILSVAWPAGAYLNAKREMERLDLLTMAQKPALGRVGTLAGELPAVNERIALLTAFPEKGREPLMVLKEITDRLPSGSWLTAFRLDGAALEIDGFSTSSNDLFAYLSRDGRFRKVEFAAPTVRQPDNLERFQIRGEYVPGVPPPPVAQGGQTPAGGGK